MFSWNGLFYNCTVHYIFLDFSLSFWKQMDIKREEALIIHTKHIQLPHQIISLSSHIFVTGLEIWKRKQITGVLYMVQINYWQQQGFLCPGNFSSFNLWAVNVIEIILTFDGSDQFFTLFSQIFQARLNTCIEVYQFWIFFKIKNNLRFHVVFKCNFLNSLMHS